MLSMYIGVCIVYICQTSLYLCAVRFVGPLGFGLSDCRLEEM